MLIPPQNGDNSLQLSGSILVGAPLNPLRQFSVPIISSCVVVAVVVHDYWQFAGGVVQL